MSSTLQYTITEWGSSRENDTIYRLICGAVMHACSVFYFFNSGVSFPGRVLLCCMLAYVTDTILRLRCIYAINLLICLICCRSSLQQFIRLNT